MYSDFEKGQEVFVDPESLTAAYFGYTQEQVCVIKSVKKAKLLLYGPDDAGNSRTYWFYKRDIAPVGTRFRKLGQPPEGEDVLDPNDPRLAWFWEDVANYADQQGFCRVFDELADDLGVPGRLRPFTVKTEVNGFPANVKVKAHSQAEAEKLVLG